MTSVRDDNKFESNGYNGTHAIMNIAGETSTCSNRLGKKSEHGKDDEYGAASDDIDASKKYEEEGEARIFEGVKVPFWWKQITARSMVISVILSVMYNVMWMDLALGSTVVISVSNVSMTFLGFIMSKAWIKYMEKCKMIIKQPFTRQELTIIQTCVASATVAVTTGGFGSCLFGMTQVVADDTDQVETDHVDPQNVKKLTVGWIIPFFLLISFNAYFVVLPFLKSLILDFGLSFPLATPSGHLINTLLAPRSKHANAIKLTNLLKITSLSFLWCFVKWLFTDGPICGFAYFYWVGEKPPRRIGFNSWPSTIGKMMLLTPIMRTSIIVGVLFSYYILWDITNRLHEGIHYDERLKIFQLYQYLVNFGLVFGDGVYQIITAIWSSLRERQRGIHRRETGGQQRPNDGVETQPRAATHDLSSHQLMMKYFLQKRDQMSPWAGIYGFALSTLASTILLPLVIKQFKWYCALVVCLLSPVLALCNAYSMGLCGLSNYLLFGYTAIFLIGGWVGATSGGILAALAACSFMSVASQAAAIFIMDIKVGFLTLTSPKAIFVSSMIGALIGCVIAPSIFAMYASAYPDMGTVPSAYYVSRAFYYRNAARTGMYVDQIHYPAAFALVSFSIGIILDLVKDYLSSKNMRVAEFIPIPVAIGWTLSTPTFSNSISALIASAIIFYWEWKNKAHARKYAPLVAIGLICGDGLWDLPIGLLNLNGIKSNICLWFLPRDMNKEIDGLLSEPK